MKRVYIVIISIITLFTINVSAKCDPSTGCRASDCTGNAQTQCMNTEEYKNWLATDSTIKGTTKDPEYVECKNNCSQYKTAASSAGYDACMATCNTMLNSTTENAIENHETRVEQAKENQKSPIDFCQSTAVIWQIVGWIFLVVKILIPILLIIFGVLDFSKCIMAGKDEELPKALKKLAFRAISAVVVFFIPTIVTLIMGLISNFGESGAKEDFKYCQTCILTPKKCDTSKDVGKQ